MVTQETPRCPTAPPALSCRLRQGAPLPVGVPFLRRQLSLRFRNSLVRSISPCWRPSRRPGSPCRCRGPRCSPGGDVLIGLWGSLPRCPSARHTGEVDWVVPATQQRRPPGDQLSISLINASTASRCSVFSSLEVASHGPACCRAGLWNTADNVAAVPDEVCLGALGRAHHGEPPHPREG